LVFRQLSLELPGQACITDEDQHSISPDLLAPAVSLRLADQPEGTGAALRQRAGPRFNLTCVRHHEYTTHGCGIIGQGCSIRQKKVTSEVT
jgi:hypothetical protein